MPVEEAPITTEEEFNAELDALLRRAHEGDVVVRGGWESPTDSEYPEWDILITRVEKRDESRR